MKNALWHYGDSFGCWGNPQKPNLAAKKGFTEYIAEYYNLNVRLHSLQGSSNDEIIKTIIRDLHRFKKGDVLIINWSFFLRYSYINKYGVVKNINNILNMITKKNDIRLMSYDNFEFYNEKYFNYTLFDKSQFVVEECMIIWKQFINPILLQIQNNMGCTVVNCFNDLTFHAYYLEDKSIIEYYHYWGISQDGGGGSGNNILLHPELHQIKWDECGSQYVKFLTDSGYYGEGEDVHYKFGIQEALSDEWISRLDNQFFKKII